MKSLACILPVLLIFSFLSCKKDSGITDTTQQLEDFSGVYRLDGRIKVLSNPALDTSFQLVVDKNDTYELMHNVTFDETAPLAEGIRNVPRGEIFNLLIYDNEPSGTMDEQWRVQDLDSIFQPGRQLAFGTQWGEASIAFAYPRINLGQYRSAGADNSTNFIRIEAVTDMITYLPAYKWVKKVTLGFDVRLRSKYDPQLPDIALTQCQATLLFIPKAE